MGSLAECSRAIRTEVDHRNNLQLVEQRVEVLFGASHCQRQDDDDEATLQ